jgi:hypothetical protein
LLKLAIQMENDAYGRAVQEMNNIVLFAQLMLIVIAVTAAVGQLVPS